MMKGINGINSIKESFNTKQVKYGGFAALITLAVIAGLILVNLLAGQFQLQIDMTSNRLFSLSEQSLQVLDNIKTPVKFYGLWRPGEESRDVMTVINLYLAKNRNISFEAIDPDRNPGFVIRYDRDKKGIARGSLIVEGEKGFKLITPYDMYDFSQSRSGDVSVNGVSIERRITGALLFAGTGNTPVVYEISGHGEVPLSALNFLDIVERENYSLKSLNLFVTLVPSDASALILNSPQKDLTSAEADKLLDYLDRGGRLLVMADYNIRELFYLNKVLESYGLAFDYGIVIESDPKFYTQDPMLAIPDLAVHDITGPLVDKTRTPVVLPAPMSLSFLETKRRTVDIKPLMTSSPAAFLRSNLNNTSPGKTPSDISGPLVLAAAVMDPSYVQDNDAQARLVVIGSGSLLPLAAQGFDPNRDFFMNSFAWLEDRPETISLRSKSLFLLPLRLNLVQIIIFGLLFILIIPMAFFVTGFVTWLRRRHL